MADAALLDDTDSPLAAGPPVSAVWELTRGTSGAILLVVLVFVCYAASTQFGYIWDDDAYVVNNPVLKSFGGLSRIWTEPGSTPQYYPMTFTSFWLEAQVFGLNAKLSHTVNLALHLASTLLLWKALRRLDVPGAWAAAAVFGVHPIQVESVAWIAERKNTLSMVFGLSALLTYLRLVGIGSAPGVAPAGEGLKVPLPDDPKRLYRLFLVLFVLGLLSKTTLSVLPGVIAVILWWKRGRVTRADWLSLLPAFGIGLLGGLVTSYVEHNPYLVGASGPEWDLSPVARLQLLGQTTAFYAWKILWPFPVGYSFASHAPVWAWAPNFNYARWPLDPASPVQWLPLAGVIVVVGALTLGVRGLGRGPLAAVLIFLGGLLPACGLFTFFPMRFAWVADHFAYVGSIGLITGAVALVATVLRRVPSVAAGLTTAVVVAMAAVTITYSLSFNNLRTLWLHTLERNPRSWLASVDLGTYVMGQANIEYADRLRSGDADAAAFRDRSRDKAEAYLRRGLRLNPNALEAYTQLGVLAIERGQFDDALESLRQAKAMAAQTGAHGYRQPQFLIGELLASRGDAAGANREFDELEADKAKLIGRNPMSFARMYTTRGDLIRREIKTPIAAKMPDADRALLKDAMDQYILATVTAPDYAPPKLKLANILLDTNNSLAALQQINDVLQVDRNNVEAKFFTAKLAETQGQYEIAAQQLLNLLQTDARYLPAHLELAKVYRTMGRPDDAVKTLQATLQFMPDATPARQLLDELQTPAATQPETTKP